MKEYIDQKYHFVMHVCEIFGPSGTGVIYNLMFTDEEEIKKYIAELDQRNLDGYNYTVFDLYSFCIKEF